MALLRGFKETEAEQQYRRGEIYYVENSSKEHVGSEQRNDRPAVIVSCDANNKHSRVLEMVFLTSAPKKDLPTHVTIRSTGSTQRNREGKTKNSFRPSEKCEKGKKKRGREGSKERVKQTGGKRRWMQKTRRARRRRF